MAIEFIFLFFLPLVSFLAGLFFFNKARNYKSQLEKIKNTEGNLGMQPGISILSGKPTAKEPLESFVKKSPCVYSKLLFEYLNPKKRQWISLNTFEKQSRFTLTHQNKEYVIDPTGAEFDILKRTTFQEDKKPQLSKDMDIKKIKPHTRVAGILEYFSFKAEPYGTVFDHEPFDESVYAALKTEPSVNELLNKYKKYRKRVVVETIEESDDVVVVGNASSQANSFLVNKGREFLIISTCTIESILKQLNGKAMLSIVFGAGLVLVSFVLVFLIFL